MSMKYHGEMYLTGISLCLYFHVTGMLSHGEVFKMAVKHINSNHRGLKHRGFKLLQSPEHTIF